MTSRSRVDLFKPINRVGHAETVYSMCIARPGGGQTHYVDRASFDAYNLDPDTWAAQHFGMTLHEYREWIRLDGAPLCGGVTAKGLICRNIIGPIQMSAEQWLEWHRRGLCTKHGGYPRE